MPNHIVRAFLWMAVLQPVAAFAAEREKPRRETPYSNSAVARQREVREIARQVDRDRDNRERREYNYQRRDRAKRGN